jgi:hypothetical protein
MAQSAILRSGTIAEVLEEQPVLTMNHAVLQHVLHNFVPVKVKCIGETNLVTFQPSSLILKNCCSL